MLALAAMALALAACGSDDARGAIHVAHLEGAVDRVMERHVARVIDRAEGAEARLVVLLVDTPGGELGAMKRIAGRIERSRVPVVTWVGPPGAQAASAGTFIVMAGHVAAMAPGTSIGAASPVLATGQDIPETLGRKVEEDTVAFARGVAELHGRNADWAEAAVREAAAASPSQALELGVVEFVSPTMESLLADLQGYEVTLLGGQVVALSAAGAAFVEDDMTRYERFLKVLHNPLIVALLLLIGLGGIAMEFFAPGLLLPGAVGVLALVLSFLGAGTLLPGEAALVLLVVGLALVTAEFFIPGGILGAVGAAALLLSLAIWAGQATASPERLALGLLLFLLVVGGLAAYWLRHYLASTSDAPARDQPPAR